MCLNVKKFIEKHVNLIESDILKLLKIAFSIMSPHEIEELSSILKSINVLDEKVVTELLTNKLNHAFDYVTDNTELDTFILQFVISPGCFTFLGKTSYDIAEFIIDNQNIWYHDVELAFEANQTYVRKV